MRSVSSRIGLLVALGLIGVIFPASLDAAGGKKPAIEASPVSDEISRESVATDSADTVGVAPVVEPNDSGGSPAAEIEGTGEAQERTQEDATDERTAGPLADPAVAYSVIGLLIANLVCAVILLMRGRPRSAGAMPEDATGILRSLEQFVRVTLPKMQQPETRSRGKEALVQGSQTETDQHRQLQRSLDSQQGVMKSLKDEVAGLKQAISGLPGRLTDSARSAVDAAFVERDARRQEEDKQAHIQRLQQRVVEIDRQFGSRVEIARQVDQLVGRLPQGGVDVKTQLGAYLKLAAAHREVENSLGALSSAKGAAVPPLKQKADTAVDQLAQAVRSFEHKAVYLCQLLDVAAAVAGTKESRDRLMKLAQIEELKPAVGEPIEDRQELEIIKDLGQGSKLVIASVESCGYRDLAHNLTLRKPRVIVQRTAGA